MASKNLQKVGCGKKAQNRRLRTSKRGWVVWAWSKAGMLLIFMGMMLAMLAAYAYAGAAEQARAASQVSSGLRGVILDVYDSSGGMSFDYELPSSVNGEAYSIELLDKPGEMAGIITRTKSGAIDVSGGASLAARLAKSSFGVIKGPDGPQSLCVTKYRGVVYVESSKC